MSWLGVGFGLALLWVGFDLIRVCFGLHLVCLGLLWVGFCLGWVRLGLGLGLPAATAPPFLGTYQLMMASVLGHTVFMSGRRGIIM